MSLKLNYGVYEELLIIEVFAIRRDHRMIDHSTASVRTSVHVTQEQLI